MTTPTPGDLSARLLAYATRKAKARDALGVPAGDYVGQEEIDTLCQAAAALSALPAAGGTDFASRFTESQARGWKAVCATLDEIDPDWILEGSTAGKTGVQRACDAIRRLATTPQPSAAEEIGPHPLNTCPKCKDYYMDCECSPDAAVGAQGGGEAAARAAFEQQAKGWRNAIPWDELHDDTRKLWRDFVARRAAAAPAAGKGVDDALVRDLLPKGWTFDCQGKQDYDTELVSLSCRYYPGNYSRDGSHSVTASIIFGEGQQTISTRDFSAASEAEVKTLAEEWARQQVALLVAVLTRQPVAGDGMVLVPREPTEAMLGAGVQFTNRDDWGADHAEGTATIWRAMVAVAQGER